MKRVFYIVVLMFFLTGFLTTLYPDYILAKKYPRDIPDLELKILNDTMGVVMQTQNRSIKQDFGFIKKKRHFLVINYIEDASNLVSLKIGDTVIYHKKELYLINEKHKLVFNKKK